MRAYDVAIVICGQAHAAAGHRVLGIPPSTFHTYKDLRHRPFRLLRPRVAASAAVATATASLKWVGSLVSRLLGAAAGVALVPVNFNNKFKYYYIYQVLRTFVIITHWKQNYFS